MTSFAVESGAEWPPGVRPPEGLPTTPIEAVVDVIERSRVRGRRINQQGYVDIYWPGHPAARADGYVFEHRLVAYEAGFLTDLSMQVHHRNHDKRDNRLANLEVLTAEQHARHHADESGYISNQFGTWPLRPAKPPRPGPRPCARCGAEIPDEARTDKVYCSNRCQVTAWKQRNRVARAERAS